jgi:hypothetical protein
VGQRVVCRLACKRFREHWRPKKRFGLPKTPGSRVTRP